MGTPQVHQGHKNLDPNPDFWAWQQKAICRGEDPEVFFLEPNERHEQKRSHNATAIAICNRCPVKEQCLQHALTVPEEFGVWGGTTPEERKVIRVRIRRARSIGTDTDGISAT